MTVNKVTLIGPSAATAAQKSSLHPKRSSAGSLKKKD